jgi:hypothetical protein
MTDDITKELAEIVEGFRWFADMGEPVNRGFLTRVDAALELYAEPFMSPEETKMTINLKDYANKLVVVTLRNEWMLVSLVNTNEGGMREYFPYSIDGKNYTYEGRVLVSAESPYDVVKIALADEDPEPVITRVEVITDTREYVNWNPNNKITTSLQDDGKTLKVFVTQNTEEPMYPKQPKPINMVEIETKRWATALSDFIDKLGGDSPALWEWKGITPTPEKVVECLQELFDFHMQIAADNELEACCEWVIKYLPYLGDFPMPEVKLRDARRPQPTLKSQALKDFEMVRKHSDVIPEILDNIENALKSLPDT